MKGKKQKEKQHKDKILNEIPIFLAKTYRIVDNPEYADTIQWIPEQNGFIVKNITDLTQKIFPRHFKHTNYASFVRQLNLYGFHKVRSNQDGHIFTHNYFQKNNPDLLPLIKRKNAPNAEPQKLEKSSQLVLCNHHPSSFIMMPDPQPNNNNLILQRQLGSLTQKHESLQNMVSVLVEQNKQIILQNKNFLNKINHMDDSYRKKLQTLIFLMVFGLKNGQNNIIVPQQLNNMIKTFSTSKKQKKPKNNNENNSQAVELFKKPTADESRFNNKKIEQILQMLKMESEGEISDLQSQQAGNPALGQNSLNLLPSHSQQKKSNLGEEQHPPPSPILSLNSLSSRYMGDGQHKMNDDWNDFLDKLQNSDVEIDHHKE